MLIRDLEDARKTEHASEAPDRRRGGAHHAAPAAVGVWAYDDAQKDQIAPGVKIGGVDVGGRNADEARKLIKREVVAPLKQPVDGQLRGQGLHADPEAARTRRRHRRHGRRGDRREPRGRAARPRLALRERRRGEQEPRAASRLLAGRRRRLRQASSPTRSTRTPSTRASPRAADSLQPSQGEAGVELEQDELHDRRSRRRSQSPGSRPRGAAPVVEQDRSPRSPPTSSPPSTRPTSPSTAPTSRSLLQHLKLKKKYTIAVGQQGLETPAGPVPRPGQAGQSRPGTCPNSAWAGRPRRPGHPAGPRRPAEGALDRDLRRCRHPRHRRASARSAAPPRTAACGCGSPT